MDRTMSKARPSVWIPAYFVGMPAAVALGTSSFAASLVALGIVVGITTYDTF